MRNKIHELYALEQLAGGDTAIHRLHPVTKLISTLVFIVTVVSFDRYAFSRLIPYIFYPTLLMALSETPYSMLLRRFLIALPFCLFAGVTNVIFDRAPAFALGGVTVSYGVVSLFTILFRTYLCVMAVLVLVSVTPLPDLTSAMRRLRVPGIFVTMFEMTYRYIGVLLDEAYSMYIAYSLRNAGQKGIAMRDMGSFVGQLLLRSVDRAERVYGAMKCRGYARSVPARSGVQLAGSDAAFLIITSALLVAFRVLDWNALFIGFFGG